MLNIVNQLSEEALGQTFSSEDDDLFNPESVHYLRSFESEPEELLKKLVACQSFEISFTVPDKKSLSDKFLCIAKVCAAAAAAAGAASPDLIFTGYGDSADSARVDCCRNALEYFRVIN